MNSLDLTRCDREPIHIPGSIQPHGVLLGLREEDRRLRVVSANVAEWLGVEPDELLGKGLETILPETDLERFFQPPPAEHGWMPRRITVGSSDGALEATVHSASGLLLVELERARAAETVAERLALLGEAFTPLEQATDLDTSCEAVTKEVRRLTGFDRVMIYRFDEDWHGSVIAESRVTGVDSYLAHHFPASDIPAQARELYMRSPLRLIPDATYEPVPLVDADPSAGPVDLSYAQLRSVAAVHLKYLANMGVQASMSASIVVDGRLWGLVACHHRTPRTIPSAVRAACGFLARLLSLRITSFEHASFVARQAHTERNLSELRHALVREPDLPSALNSAESDFLSALDAEGGALLLGGEARLFGSTPSRDEVRQLATRLGTERVDDVFQTRHLAAALGSSFSSSPGMAGVVAVPLDPRAPRDWLMWFRPETLETISWAGDPHKPAEAAGQALNPRQSFASWKETVRDRSRRWPPETCTVARAVRDAVLQSLVHRAQELEDLNRRLTEERADAVRERDELLALVTHDLRSPISAVHLTAESLLAMLPEQPAPADLERKMRRVESAASHAARLVDELFAGARIAAGKQLSGGRRRVDVSEFVERKVEEYAERSPRHRIVLTCTVRGNQAEWDPSAIERVVDNLLGNAIKYSPEGGEIRVEAWQRDGSVIISVQDQGVGIPAEELAQLFKPFYRASNVTRRMKGTGLGLAIARRIADEHGGDLTVESTEGSGSTFTLRLPLRRSA